MARDQRELRLRRSQCKAWPQARYCVNKMCFAVAHSRVGALPQRSEDLRVAGQLETGGGDTDHGIRLPFKDERAADSGRIPAKIALPQTVADDGDGRRAGLVLIGPESASVNRSNTERGKQIRRDFSAVHVLRFSRLADGAPSIRPARDVERSAFALGVDEIRIRGAPELTERLGESVHGDQSVRLRIG